MGPRTATFLFDVLLWIVCIFATVALAAFEIVRDPAWGMACGALWIAIRARSAADVNTAHTFKNRED